MRMHIWYNGGNSDGPHNWRYNPRYEAALKPQTKAVNDMHIQLLVNDWLQKHAANPPATIARNPAAIRAWMRGQETKAREWAVKNEPKKFLEPLLRSMNGIPADKDLRRNSNGSTAILSSSWVGDAKLNNGSTVYFDLGGKSYGFPLAEIGGLDGLRRCLTSPSIGRYISKNWIGKLPSSRIKRK